MGPLRGRDERGGGKGLLVLFDKGIGGEHFSVTVLHVHAQHATSTTPNGRTEVGWGKKGWMDGWMACECRSTFVSESITGLGWKGWVERTNEREILGGVEVEGDPGRRLDLRRAV